MSLEISALAHRAAFTNGSFESPASTVRFTDTTLSSSSGPINWGLDNMVVNVSGGMPLTQRRS